MKRVFKQWLAGLLSVVLVFTLLPAAALAEEADGAMGQTAVEQVQALIDELPDAESITADNRADVQAQIDAIDAAMAELTESEAASLDTTRYDAAVEALLALDAPSALEQVQALIDALPDAEEITVENRADVEAQLTAIDEAKLALEDEELDALDVTRYMATVEAIQALDDMAGADEPATIATTVSNIPYLEYRDGNYENWSPDGTWEEKTCPSATRVESDTTTWTEGWYVVAGNVTITDRIQTEGDVHLILADGYTLTANMGITVKQDRGYINKATLTIHGQSKRTGKLVVPQNPENCAAIGARYDTTFGDVNILGVTVDVTTTQEGGCCIGSAKKEYAAFGEGMLRVIRGHLKLHCGNTYGCFGYYVGSNVSESIVEYSESVSCDDDGPASWDYSERNFKDTIVLNQNYGEPFSGTVYGKATLPGDYTVPSGGQLTVRGDGNLTVPYGTTLKIEAGATLRNEGKITNNGTVDIWGNLEGDGDIEPNPPVDHYKLEVTDLSFANAAYGAKATEQAITIKNTGAENVTIESVTVDKDFDIVTSSNKNVAVGNQNTSWKIKSKENLSAGEHNATITVIYNSGRKATAGVTFKVIKATPTVNVSASGNPTYGSEIKLTTNVTAPNVSTSEIADNVTFKAGTGSEVLGTVKAANGTATLTIAADNRDLQHKLFGTDGKNVTVTAEYAGNSNIDGKSGTTKVTVNPKTLTFKFTAAARAYDKTRNVTGTFELSGVLGGDNVNVSAYTATVENADVGNDKTVTASVTKLGGADAQYYTPGAVTGGTVTISKAGISSVTAPTVKVLTYNGGPQELVTAPASPTEDGTMEYALGSVSGASDDYNNEIPVAVNAGTYYVWYKVKGDGNHEDSAEDKVEVTIKQKPVTLTWTGHTGLVYTGSPMSVTATTTDFVGADKGDSVDIKISGNTETDAGTHLATAILEGPLASNYTLTNDTQEYTIGKAEVTFSVSNADHAYDGTAKKATISNTNTSGAPVLAEGSGYAVTYGGDKAPSKTDVGEYDIHITLTAAAAKNYKFAGKGDSETELTVEGTKLSIGKTTSSVNEVTITTADGELTYGDEFTISAKVNAPGTVTGTVTFSAGGVGLGKAESGVGGVWTISVGADDKDKQHAIFGTGENTTITAEYSGDKNVTGSSGTNATVTVAPKPLTYTVTATGRVWNGETGVDVTLAATNTVTGDTVTLAAKGDLDNEGRAGTYGTVNLSDVEIDGADGKYYTTDSTKTGMMLESEIEITKHDSSITAPAGKPSLTYTGEPQVLIDAATDVEGGTAKYYVGEKAPDDGSTDWQTDVSKITGLNAGEYTVWYYIDGDENHEDTTADTVLVTIAPALVSFTIGAENKANWAEKDEANGDPNPDGYTQEGSGTDYALSMTYDSYTHTANVAQSESEAVQIEPGTVNGFTVTYKRVKDSAGSPVTEDAGNSVRDAGTYEIWVTINPVEGNIYNYVFNGHDSIHSLKIGEITVKPYPTAVSWAHLKYVYHGHTMHPDIHVLSPFKADDVQMTSGLPKGFDHDHPEEYTGDYLVAFAETKGSDVDVYPVEVTLYGKNAGNYTVTDPTEDVTIIPAPVTITVGDNTWVVQEGTLSRNTVTLRSTWGAVTAAPDQDEGTDHQYPAAGSAIKAALNTTIEYWKDGEKVDGTPTEPGTYQVWVAIGNPNFRHSSTTDGASHNVGELVITDNPESVSTYTVTFDPGYEDAPAGPAQLTGVFANQTVVIPPISGENEDGTKYDLTRQGYSFLGWSYDGRTYQPNEELHMPAANVTLKAEWTSAVALNGTVLRESGAGDPAPVNGATVVLKHGSEEVAETVTDRSGAFDFGLVTPGIYNLEITCENGSGAKIVKTFLVVLEDGGSTAGEYILPDVALNTVVEVTPGITAAVDMGGIVSGEDISDVYTSGDRTTVRDGGTVEFKMTIQSATLTTGQTEEIPVPEDRIGMVLDLELTKTVTQSSGSSTETGIHETKIPVITVIHLPAELQGKSSYTIYRFHDKEDEDNNSTTVMQTITTSPNSDGEYLKVVRDGTAIEIHAEFYSTYVLTWQQSSGGGGGSSRYPVNLPSETDAGTITSDPTSARPGDRVTLTVTPDEGYHLGSLTVTDRNGKALEITDNGDGTYTFTQPYCQVTVKAEYMKCGSLDFTDLDIKAWYHDYTDYVIVHGLMKGIGGSIFEPGGTVNRAQMVTVLWNMSGKPVVNYYMTYSDVSEESWYAEAIRWATSEGIVDGYGNGKFGPNDPITREQMAAMIYRYEQKYGDGGFTGDWMYRLPFTDLDQISDWAFESVAWCNMKGVIKGKGNNIFDPKGLAKRSEMAAILTRFCSADVTE